VWDAETGLLRETLSGHAARVNDAAFSPDGRFIITASQDDTARIWDSESGLLLGALAGHTAQIYCARFSPDGRVIATSSADATVRIHIADLRRLLDWARRQLLVESRPAN
jgi:WD40 repeat protein